MNLKTRITKLHYDKNPSGFMFNLFEFFSMFYSFGVGLKNLLYDIGIFRPKKVDAFVISVGNYTTGGVGKTPVVAEIARYLIDKGERVAVVSRGYGGKLDNRNVNVISDGINLHYNAEMAGDEPYWLAVNLNMCAVLTCADRYKACEYAIEQFGITTIILDDGFQHRKLHRDLDIVLVDSEKQFGNGYVLPAGPLREDINEAENTVVWVNKECRADKFVVVSKNVFHDRALKYANELKQRFGKEIYLCKIEPDYVYNIVSGEHLCGGTEITALSAIGQPEQFYGFLEKDYIIKKKITFDDHHQYIKKDIKNIDGIIVTTEKDAVKLALLGNTNIYALKLKTEIDVENLLETES